MGEKGIRIFKESYLLGEEFDLKQGLATGNNDKFLKLWFEVSLKHISFNAANDKKWYPCQKGGELRKWYGNNVYIVNWQNDAMNLGILQVP